MLLLQFAFGFRDRRRATRKGRTCCACSLCLVFVTVAGTHAKLVLQSLHYFETAVELHKCRDLFILQSVCLDFGSSRRAAHNGGTCCCCTVCLDFAIVAEPHTKVHVVLQSLFVAATVAEPATRTHTKVGHGVSLICGWFSQKSQGRAQRWGMLCLQLGLFLPLVE